jgi:hypothetical protein
MRIYAVSIEPEKLSTFCNILEKYLTSGESESFGEYSGSELWHRQARQTL